MNIPRYARFALWRAVLVAFFFALILPARAQTAGNAFHVVKSGETLYSIASVYGTNVTEIRRKNPGLGNTLRIGQLLIVPPPGGFIYHTVQKGETLYQLSRTYQISVADICEHNPGLDANHVKEGTTLRLPQSVQTSRQSSHSASSAAKAEKYHKVKKKETLYSISKLYGISEEDLKKANPDMYNKGYQLKKDAIIKIPTVSYSVVSAAQASSGAAKKGMKSIHVSVIMPLKSNTSDGAKAVEFYQGLLLAIDSLRSHGVSTTVHAYHSGTTEADVQHLLRDATLKESDIIFGPWYQAQVPILNDYSKRNAIPLVVPFVSKCREVYENPYLIQMNAPDMYKIEKACEGYVSLFHNDHTVLCGILSREEENFGRLLVNHLGAQKMSYRTLTGQINEETLLRSLSAEKYNTVVLTDHKITLLNVIVPQLKTFIKKHPEYKIRLCGYPEWLTYINTQLDNYYYFDTYCFTDSYRNPMAVSTVAFDRSYQRWFGTLVPGMPCMAMAGFDFGYYALRGMSLYGKGFVDSNVKTVPYQTPIQLKRVSNWGGLVNEGIWFVHYKKDHTIEQIKVQ